jgi:hypothetical protein
VHNAPRLSCLVLTRGRNTAYDCGLPTNGLVLSRTVVRDPYRRLLVTSITNGVDGVPVSPLTFTHDLLGRVVSRNADAFAYNSRSEVASATISNTVAAYAYRHRGPLLSSEVLK